MSKLFFIFSRLWRFNNLYFLKPNDAVNDTLTASLLIDFDWTGRITEIGSGDGVFSYILHGGYFSIMYDRYSQVKLNKNDIYDTHTESKIKPKVSLNFPNIETSLDKKNSHLQKVSEIGFSKKIILCEYENLPFERNTLDKIFFYIPHNVIDYEKSLKKAFEVLKPNGRMILLTYNSCFKPFFVCYKLSKIFSGKLKKIFFNLDNGRFKELSIISKSPEEWKDFFTKNGMQIEVVKSGLSQFAWSIYDTQTRPVFKYLIRIFNNLSPLIRSSLKFFILCISFPYILIFYIIFSNDFINFGGKDCYLAYQLIKK